VVAESATALVELATAYANAWNHADVDASLALSTSDTIFHLHDGHPPANGSDAVAAAVREFFGQWSDVSFSRRGVFFGKESWAVEWTLTARSRAVGGKGAAGVKVSCDGVDIVTARDGLVAAKHVYYDATTVASMLEAARG
jgi:hypothetical protein